MKSDFILYIDFDSTLYDTAAFAVNLWVLLAQKTGLPFDQVRAASESYYFHPSLGGYEYEKHIMQYGLAPDEMWRALDTITSGPGYLYPDSVDFIQNLLIDGYVPKILTFGEKRFQKAKITPLLPLLTGTTYADKLEVIVVDKKKNEYIGRLHPGQRGVLVDDKPGQQLPPGFTEIHIDRSGGITKPDMSGQIIRVSDLQQARQAIDALAAN